jgi:hypothetical protein
MRSWSWIVTLVALAAIPAAAQTPVPDLRGTWKGDSQSIVADGANPHHPGSPQSGPRLSSAPFTFTVDKQDGRRFSGSFSSPRSTESIIGVLTNNNAILAVDNDGYTFGTVLAPNRLEMCYLQITASGRVASCTEMTKQP